MIGAPLYSVIGSNSLFELAKNSFTGTSSSAEDESWIFRDKSLLYSRSEALVTFETYTALAALILFDRLMDARPSAIALALPDTESIWSTFWLSDAQFTSSEENRSR